MSLRRLGISNYHLFWRRQIQSGDESVELRFLAQYKDDPGAMRDLRALLAESALGIPNTRLTDDQVLAGIARLLASGELLAVRELPVHGGSATQPDAAGPSDAPAPSPAPSSSSKPGPESPTLPSNTNGAAQAASLIAAASSGAPFCAH